MVPKALGASLGRPGDAFGRILAALGAPGAPQDRLWGGIWVSKSRPGRIRTRPRNGLGRPNRPKIEFSSMFGRFGFHFHGLWNDFSSILSCRAKAPMCCSYQFLQCFVGFARSSHRTRMSADKPRKSSHCALQNRGQERPRNPKSSPSDPGRAKKHVRSARGASEKWLVSANEPTSSEKARPVPPRSARTSEDAEQKFRNLRMD